MASFIATGMTADDYWLVNGSKDFSILPANTITGWTIDLPIRLHVGVKEVYGQLHMEKHRGEFRDRWNRTIPELIYCKLGQGAAIFHTEKDIKKKFQFAMIFQALLLVERRFKDLEDGTRDEYLSMVSFYKPKPYQIENPNYAIARYDSGNLRLSQVRTQAAAAASSAAAPSGPAAAPAAVPTTGSTPQGASPAPV